MKVSIVGTAGVPSEYGGFETLADNLVSYHEAKGLNSHLTVYCSGRGRGTSPSSYRSAHLRYVRLSANGVQSIPYDVLSMAHSVVRGSDAILVLGVSGALFIPFIRIFSRTQVITNIDGIEWKRDKWNKFAKFFLKSSERIAVRWSHAVISDNDAITDYVSKTYGVVCRTIAYGGDHAVAAPLDHDLPFKPPERYAFALSRIEPENSVSSILEAFSAVPDQNLIYVGNWENSSFGQGLRRRYAGCNNILMADPIYDVGKLRVLRAGADLYVHGHSAGGTNPALVEMMHFGLPIVAHGCVFNRRTTENEAHYFEMADDLVKFLTNRDYEAESLCGLRMLEIARRRYTWNEIGKSYFNLIENAGSRKDR